MASIPAALLFQLLSRRFLNQPSLHLVEPGSRWGYDFLQLCFTVANPDGRHVRVMPPGKWSTCRLQARTGSLMHFADQSLQVFT